MMMIGFSTGALAYGNFSSGLEMIRKNKLKDVELSALREPELEPLVEAIDDLDLSDFDYVSVHAPSAIRENREAHAVTLLTSVARRGWPIVVHPDVIREASLWESLGRQLTIENNDRRKECGQRCLRPLF